MQPMPITNAHVWRRMRAPRSVFVLAFDGDALVGASTGLPLADDDAAFQAPFIAQDLAIARVF